MWQYGSTEAFVDISHPKDIADLDELPADVVKQIGKRHPLLIPPFTNDTLRRAVRYLWIKK